MSPERKEAHQNREQEATPYYQAARFSSERPAWRAYSQAQETIFTNDCSLSAFRFQLNNVYHVAVLGEPPPEDLERQLQAILSTGEPATLPSEIPRVLQELRAQANKQGVWVERHHRPGKQM